MKHVFIVNPIAGKGRALKFVKQIKSSVKSLTRDYIIEITKRPGHATQIASKYKNNKDTRIYSVGGDGTLNEIVNGLIGGICPLGIIPAGSGNDFIRSVYSHKIEDVIPETMKGIEKAIDVGTVNGRHFINISSMGFDAEAAFIANKLNNKKFVPSGLSYYFGVIATLLKYRSHPMKIVIDEKEINLKCLLIAVANGKFYGGGMMAAPSASIDDGLLDVCLVEDMSRLKILKFFPTFIKGGHTDIEGVHFYRGSKIKVYSDIEMHLNIDGEIISGKATEFGIIPASLGIIVPTTKEV